MLYRIRVAAAGLILLTSVQLMAQQTVPGAGNSTAADIARGSRVVQSAMDFLVSQAKSLNDPYLRNQTLDAINNPGTCVTHRANLADADKQAIVDALKSAGLVRLSDDATFPGGLKAGVFPPLTNDGSKCPMLPQPFYSAPGSVYHGHHSYPGGLPVHESNNDVADQHLADEYRSIYGGSEAGGLPAIHNGAANGNGGSNSIFIDQDIIVAAPLWHDWAKPIVFQWKADGSEFSELNFGGNGATDNNGAAGDSTTGGHHIIGIAEAMKRGLSPAFVITQASAHSAPTSGNEFKVVNWLRAAAIMAGIDPVAKGYLTTDSQNHFRLPALRQLGEINFLATTPSQTNILVEYELHNLSDADFTFSGPAVSMVETVLAQLAGEFGFSSDPTDPVKVATYNVHYRNPALSSLTAERLQIIYANQGVDGVRQQLQLLRKAGII
jgi:hypothetical protein